MSTAINTLFPHILKASYAAAHSLTSIDRQKIAIQAIKGDIPILHTADHYNVSRKFIYEQKNKALEGIAQAFEEQHTDDKDKVLFHIPVTKKWLEQVVLASIFTCRASYQGVSELFRDLFDYKICKGTVHNIVHNNLEQAKIVNRQQDLSEIKVGLHDEIYQAGNPVLVGCCARSTYCYLLSLVEVVDANNWGVHLLDLKEKQKLTPNCTVIDGGNAARKGQKDAWPETPAHGDIFHALKPFLGLVSYLENRAMNAIKAVENIKYKIQRPWAKCKGADKQLSLLQNLVGAEEASRVALSLLEDMTTLYRWLKNDILSLVGPSYIDRKALLKFFVEELRLREDLCKHQIEPVRTYLENHNENLLEFVPIMERQFIELSKELEVSLSDVLDIYLLKGLPSSSQKYWIKYTELRARLGEKFYKIDNRVSEILNKTVRANSLVENINSRLRTYFTLRRELGNEYLEFLQFFLNHRRFMRSECKERIGKSPKELLTGKEHKHWLEMLGFKLFKQAA